MKYRALIILILIICLVGCGAPQSSPTETEAPSYGDITGAQMELLLEQPGLTIIDVRTPEEYAEGHLPGAINIPLNELERNFSELKLDPEQPLALYCRSSNRSRKAYQFLQTQGFEKIYHAPGVSQHPYALVK